MKYYHFLKDVCFPHRELLEIAEKLPESCWLRGKCRNGIAWPVMESRNIPEHRVFDSLIDFLNVDSKTAKLNHNVFFSKIFPGGLPVHYDQSRSCALNFPLSGERSETIFVDYNDRILDRFTIVEESASHPPILINTKQRHGVIYSEGSRNSRILLSFSIYEPFEDIVNKYENGLLFKENEFFQQLK